MLIPDITALCLQMFGTGNCWKLVIENTGLAVVAVFEVRMHWPGACMPKIHPYLFT